MSELPERLLRGALGDAASATPAGPCVDASALAAWADETMSTAERTAFERHAVDCARCQSLMAAMARTELLHDRRVAWWRRSSVPWLVPLAAGAAAIVIVASLGRMQLQSPLPQGQTPPPPARVAEPAPPVSAGSRASTAAPTSSPMPQAAEPRPDGTAAMQATSQRKQTAASLDAVGGPPPKREAVANDAAAVPPAAPAPAVPSAKPVPAPATGETAAQRVSPTAAPPAAGEATAAAPAAPPAALAGALRAEGVRDRFSVPPAAEQVMPATMVIASPDRNSQWRIGHGAIAHSADAGRTWQSQASGVQDLIRSGMSPAPRICWLAGARGLVMLTIDGVTWRRLTSPDAADLTGIQALDGTRATVTTAAGAKYETSDGGTTWTRR